MSNRPTRTSPHNPTTATAAAAYSPGPQPQDEAPPQPPRAPRLSLCQELRCGLSCRPNMYNRVRSWRLLRACAAVAVLTGLAFLWLGSAITAAAVEGGWTGPAAALQAFDKRFGYSLADVNTALAAWGVRGRALYLAWEALDVLFFIPSLLGIDLVIFNRLGEALVGATAAAGAGAAAGGSRRAAQLARVVRGVLVRLPLLMAAVDLLEDAGQVALTVWFGTAAAAESAGAGAPGWEWEAAVVAASAVNRVKWVCIGGSVGLALAAWGAMLWARQRRRDGGEGAAAAEGRREGMAKEE
ncbi:hypothetical protein PLESTB_000426500 [Pleodorina starrii]|uniref:Uncharacterized protein n=1 Tax=Pleodorina starrii TaxID=330485 RepID=A0A9W6BFP1_9CHLO|nr:hypothetical protein PLESTB_000426500 [Pleodorina starrii]GLC74358.1 hypothetical protein PLESTF_001503200 [Pleodorina starrii]